MENNSIQNYVNWCKDMGLKPSAGTSVELYDQLKGRTPTQRIMQRVLRGVDEETNLITKYRTGYLLLLSEIKSKDKEIEKLKQKLENQKPIAHGIIERMSLSQK